MAKCVYITIWLPNLLKPLYLDLYSNVLSHTAMFSFRCPTNSEYLDCHVHVMFAHRCELWRGGESIEKAAHNISSDKNGALFNISLSHDHLHPLFFFSSILSLDVIWTGKGYLTGSGSPPAAPSCSWRSVSQEPLLPSPSLRRAWLPACVLVIFIHPDLLACSWRQQSQSPPSPPDPLG